jgi:hypothetical protein
MRWEEAIRAVLKDASGPMHYNEISDQIIERKLRPEGVGATPARTVNAKLTTSINDEGSDSPFVRVDRGIYTLQAAETQALAAPESNIEETGASSPTTGVVNAFGMFWERSKVFWRNNPGILGQQQVGSTEVDFSPQKGVYLLHDAQGVVYVGRATDQYLGQRLFQHTTDRLGGRWTRFSWFGVYPVQEDGSLETTADFQLSIDIVIATMEAVLIEGLEPRQNRRRGDDFNAREFLQYEDPRLEIGRKKAVVEEMMDLLNAGPARRRPENGR